MKTGLFHLYPLPILVALAALLIALAWSEPPVAPTHFGPPLSARSEEPLVPLPLPTALPDPRRVALGERLYHDARLSGDGTVSCASCHPLPHGTDGRARSIGVGGTPSLRNAPTVLNAALNYSQNWDGRTATLFEQVTGPLLNPQEMASSWTRIEAVLHADRHYVEGFALAYAGRIERATITDALVSYLRTLLTPNAPFDRYLRGERDAISAEAREGYALFKSMGCASCHQGAGIGGNLFQRLGIVADYFADHPQSAADLGRQHTTGREEDRHVFRVPTLRNIAVTAPYLHDGSIPDLDQAVRTMARYQLGRRLSDQEARLLVSFLESLTGELPSPPSPSTAALP